MSTHHKPTDKDVFEDEEFDKMYMLSYQNWTLSSQSLANKLEISNIARDATLKSKCADVNLRIKLVMLINLQTVTAR